MTAVAFDSSIALIVVDVQNDFAHPDGSLYVSGAEQVIAEVNELVIAGTEAGATVFYTQDWHPPSTPHFQVDGGTWPVHCVRETWGAELHDSLRMDGVRVRKGTGGEDGYSGFTVRDPGTGETSPTELAELLRIAGVERTVVVGLATDYCVIETAVDSIALGFPSTVVRSAVAAVNLNPGDGDAAFERMAASGVVLV
jgi:nicotinamidase/pyrazinamidase